MFARIAGKHLQERVFPAAYISSPQRGSSRHLLQLVRLLSGKATSCSEASEEAFSAAESSTSDTVAASDRDARSQDSAQLPRSANTGDAVPSNPFRSATRWASPAAATARADDTTSSSEGVVTIDTTGLVRPAAPHSHGPPGAHKEPETEMARHLKALIRFRGGPITLAEYMSEALTNPTAGYYMQRDVFGAAGDFTTSPEISQLFGEMIGIWCITVWQQLGSPTALRLAELGPGRGTLMADLLRCAASFPPFQQALRVHLVEVSPTLRAAQHQALGCDEANISAITNSQVSWHRSLEEVPPDTPTLYIAHEFFDALPVHQFQRTARGWRERLVDVAPDDSPHHLRLVLSPGPTPASQLLVPRRLQALGATGEEMSALEVSPQAMATSVELAKRVASSDGAALVIDYGQDAPYAASLAAIRQHRFLSLLEQPGRADLSARVDFSAIRQAVAEAGMAATIHGPIPQAQLLQSCGIDARLEALCAGATPEQAEALRLGHARITGGSGAGHSLGENSLPGKVNSEEGQSAELEGMGFSYKALAIARVGAALPVGFEQAGDTV